MRLDRNRSLTVVTFTVDRVKELIRCIESIQKQENIYDIHHKIYSENVDSLVLHPRLKNRRGKIEWCKLVGKPNLGPSSPRMARLRHTSVLNVVTPYCAFIDDDNELEPDHFSSLFDLIDNKGFTFTYSWRRLIERSGQSFKGDRFPWHPDIKKAEARYKWCIDHGVIIQGDSVIRDGPINDLSECNVATVDMNEWLFKTELLKEIGFELNYTEEDIKNQIGEDDKLLHRILKAKTKIGCTYKPTLIYHLGGISNQRSKKVY